VSELEFNVPFQHKHGYIRDEILSLVLLLLNIHVSLSLLFIQSI